MTPAADPIAKAQARSIEFSGLLRPKVNVEAIAGLPAVCKRGKYRACFLSAVRRWVHKQHQARGRTGNQNGQSDWHQTSSSRQPPLNRLQSSHGEHQKRPTRIKTHAPLKGQQPYRRREDGRCSRGNNQRGFPRRVPPQHDQANTSESSAGTHQESADRPLCSDEQQQEPEGVEQAIGNPQERQDPVPWRRRSLLSVEYTPPVASAT